MTIAFLLIDFPSLFKLDLTRKTTEPAGKSPGGVRETHRTVLCVGVTLVCLAVTLVGTMLSVGSRYQEMVFAKKWEGGFPPKGRYTYDVRSGWGKGVPKEENN